MRSAMFSLRISVSLALLLLSIGVVSAAEPVDTAELRTAVTLDNVRAHQAALQSVADGNGGTRASGTPGYVASADYVANQLEAASYDVLIQEFEYLHVEEVTPSEFEQTAPVPTVYPNNDPAGFQTMTYSGIGDVTALVQPVDVMIPPPADPAAVTSGCEATDFAGFIPGNIALVQRGTCFFQTKVQNATDAGAVAVIIFNDGQPGRTDAFFGTLLTPMTIPVIGTAYAIGEELASASATARIKVDSIFEMRTSQNVIAELPGERNRVLMAGVHLDSVSTGPGINDNGSGAAALLEIALQMKDLGIVPRNTVRFAWWGAEETGLAGSNYYVSNLTNTEVKRLGAYLELEMLGSPNYVRFVFDGDGSEGSPPGPKGSANIEQVIRDYFLAQGLPVAAAPLDLRHSYTPFFGIGIPVGGLFGGDTGIKTPEQAATYGGTAGAQYDPCYHLACDTFDNVSLLALDEMADAAAHAILTFAMRSASVASYQRQLPSCEAMGYDFWLKVDPESCSQSSSNWAKNPGDWPVGEVTVGGVTYSVDEAIAVMNAKSKGDKSYDLFDELVAAKLNLITCGIDSTPFIHEVIAEADAWLADNPPGSRIKAKDPAWDEGSALHSALSAFNGGTFQPGTYPIDSLGEVTIETLDGLYFDWSSTRSADAVIVKGGPDANVYEYDPEAFDDTGLHAPINPKNGQPYGLSYVEFCFDYDIEITVRKFHDLDGDGIPDAGEPEIGVDQFVMADGTLGGTTGWPYTFTYPLDEGGTTTHSDLFWTPETHERSFAGLYTVEESMLPNWEQTAVYLDGVMLPLAPAVVIPYAGDADEAYEVLFGNIGYAEISGRKFEDLDGDGLRDDDEPPLAGVEITLEGVTVDGDVVLLTVLTDDTGMFAFTGLLPGDYTVTETAWPAGGWLPSTPTLSGPHTLSAGDSLDLGWVFGNFLPGSIHGYKFVDVNGNGVEDDGEPGLAGVTIELTGDVDGNGVLDLVDLITDSEGEYGFTGLWPGDYAVAEVVPDGYVPTTPVSVDVAVVSGIELVARDGQAMLTDEQIAAGYEEVVDESLTFGNFQYGSIHGYKFHDLDADGVRDPGEPGLAGWTIELSDADGNVIALTVTDANGEYAFTDLGPGTYTVLEASQADWLQSTANPPPLVLQSGQEYVAEDGQSEIGPVSGKFETLEPLLAFGNFQYGSIHGYKFNDLNGNGVDDGEPRLEGWSIELIDAAGNVIAITTTGPGGEYAFMDLYPGDYSVHEVAQVEWVPSTENPVLLSVGSGEEHVAVAGQAGLPPDSTKVEVVDARLAFGNFLAGSIHGYKFHDFNGNGVDDGEPRLEGWSIELIDAAGNLIATTTTGPGGEYAFTGLYPGDYSVHEVLKFEWVPSTENPVLLSVGSGEEHVAVAGQAGLPPDSTKVEIVDARLAFGNFLAGSIHGYKFDDLNANGLDDGEPRLEGWSIELIDAAGNVITTTTTGPGGEYAFLNLPVGAYSVGEVLQEGWTPTTEILVSLFVSSGEEYVAEPGQAMLPPESSKVEVVDPRLAFGNSQLGSIHGYKFNDLNENGSWDAGESGLQGWIIELYLEGILIANTVTDPNGEYGFIDLLPGLYSVSEVAQPGWIQTTASPPPLTLQSGQEFVAQDGQAQLPPGSTKYETLVVELAFGNFLANRPPIAGDDEYLSTGNVGLSVAAPGVLDNDLDPDFGDSKTAFSIPGTNPTTQGGTVTLASDGGFDYAPPAGYTGLDTFEYDVCDAGGLCDTGLVEITVSDMIWFVDNSFGAPGDGTLAAPFNALPASTGTAGDCIFLAESGAGAYSGPLTLQNGQILVGNGASADIPTVCGITMAPHSRTLPATGGSRPSIISATNGINLASNNTVRGLDIGDIGGSGFKGTVVGTLAISEVAVGDGTPSGGGIEVATSGTLNVTFDSLSASSSTDEGIRLIGVSGSFAVTAPDGTISTTGVRAIHIDGNASLNINTLTFASVSSSGPSSGVVLTDTTGSFTVTGTGGDCPANAANCSGGAITGAFIAVDVDNAQDVSLNAMQIDGNDYGVTLDNVDGFLLDNSRVTNNGWMAGHQGIRARELSGPVQVTNSLFDGNFEDHIEVVNTSNNISSIVTVTGNLFDANDPAQGNNGISYASRNGANPKNVAFDIANNTFQNIRATAVQIDAEADTTHTISIGGPGAGNTFDNNNTALNLTNNFTGNVTAVIDNNVMTNQGSSGAGQVINLFAATSSAAGSSFSATVSNNTIGTSSVSDSGTPNGNALRIVSQGTTTFNALVDGNAVHGVTNGGIDAQARDGVATLNLTLRNNELNFEDSIGVNVAGTANAAGETVTVCADIGGPAIENTISNVELTPFFVFSGVAVQQAESAGGSSTFTLPNYVPGSVETFIDGQNTITTPGAVAAVNVFASGTFTGGASCTLP